MYSAPGAASCHGKNGKRLGLQALHTCQVAVFSLQLQRQLMNGCEMQMHASQAWLITSSCQHVTVLSGYCYITCSIWRRIAQTAPVYLHYDVNWHARGVAGGPSPHISSDMFCASNIHSYLSIVYQELDITDMLQLLSKEFGAGDSRDGLTQCFPNVFCSRTPFGLKSNHGSSHPCSRKYWMSGR